MGQVGFALSVWGGLFAAVIVVTGLGAVVWRWREKRRIAAALRLRREVDDPGRPPGRGPRLPDRLSRLVTPPSRRTGRHYYYVAKADRERR